MIPNFEEEAEMLEWAGISFGEENTLRLQKSIKRLATMSGADTLRFIGKIFGTQSDYWIAAGNLNQAEEIKADNTSISLSIVRITLSRALGGRTRQRQSSP